TDSAGALVPGVTVTVTNEGTNVTRQAMTNSAGTYSFPSLLPGTYRLRAEKSGFQSVMRSGIQLQVQQVARLDFRMEVGQVTRPSMSRRPPPFWRPRMPLPAPSSITGESLTSRLMGATSYSLWR